MIDEHNYVLFWIMLTLNDFQPRVKEFFYHVNFNLFFRYPHQQLFHEFYIKSRIQKMYIS